MPLIVTPLPHPVQGSEPLGRAEHGNEDGAGSLGSPGEHEPSLQPGFPSHSLVLFLAQSYENGHRLLISASLGKVPI